MLLEVNTRSVADVGDAAVTLNADCEPLPHFLLEANCVGEGDAFLTGATERLLKRRRS